MYHQKSWMSPWAVILVIQVKNWGEGRILSKYLDFVRLMYMLRSLYKSSCAKTEIILVSVQLLLDRVVIFSRDLERQHQWEVCSPLYAMIDNCLVFHLYRSHLSQNRSYLYSNAEGIIFWERIEYYLLGNTQVTENVQQTETAKLLAVEISHPRPTHAEAKECLTIHAHKILSDLHISDSLICMPILAPLPQP